MCLTACGTGPGRIGISPEPEFWQELAPKSLQPLDKPADKPTAFAPACPTPTDAAKIRAIEAEIERAIKAGASPDALATEWERLDQAARICRNILP